MNRQMMTKDTHSALQILVGARDLYERFPHMGDLIHELDGQNSYCALGALAKAGGQSDDDLETFNNVENGENRYDGVLLDGNGIEVATWILAKAIIDLNPNYEAASRVADKDNLSIEDAWEIIYSHNDNNSKNPKTFVDGKYVFAKIPPSPEILKSFDLAIKVASA